MEHNIRIDPMAAIYDRLATLLNEKGADEHRKEEIIVQVDQCLIELRALQRKEIPAIEAAWNERYNRIWTRLALERRNK